MATTDKALIDALMAHGYTPAEALAIADGTPPKAAETVAPVVEPKAQTAFFQNVILARVPCAYKSPACKGITFAPKGVGSKQHTTCPKGKAALKKARA